MTRNLMLALAVLTVAVFGTAAPAVAQPDSAARGCPPPFTAFDRAEQLELAEELGVPPEEVDATIERLDRNDDTVLCFLFLRDGRPNIIDNRLPR